MLTPKIVQKGELKLVGVTLETSMKDGINFRSIPQFWDECFRSGIVDRLAKSSGELGMLGICHDADDRTQDFRYSIMVETNDQAPPPVDAVSSLTLAPATYAVFTAIGPLPDAIQSVWKAIHSQWLPQAAYVHAPVPDFEAYPPFDDERGDPTSPKCVSEVWIPIVAR